MRPGATRYEADERVFASLNESIPGIDWKKLADYMVGRVVVHGERRAHEMEEVAETLRAMASNPSWLKRLRTPPGLER